MRAAEPKHKEELCQALTALKKGQSIAAGPGADAHPVNLMRRVHTLVPSSGFALGNMRVMPSTCAVLS